MKVVILAGGLGTRLIEETNLKPKPMVEIGGKPILWHIMKIYAQYGFNEFVVCLGYKGEVIRQFFYDYFNNHNDITFDLDRNKMEIHTNVSEKWKVTLVDTGSETLTGGRISRIEKYIKGERFMLTYGDGVSSIDINDLLKFHIESKKTCTLSAVKPEGRFGVLEIDEENTVSKFSEKNKEDIDWVNGGFFVCEPGVFDYLEKGDDKIIWERSPLEKLAKNNQLGAYKHEGFWKPMDTLKDKIDLNELWDKNEAKWKVW